MGYIVNYFILLKRGLPMEKKDNNMKQIIEYGIAQVQQQIKESKNMRTERFEQKPILKSEYNRKNRNDSKNKQDKLKRKNISHEANVIIIYEPELFADDDKTGTDQYVQIGGQNSQLVPEYVSKWEQTKKTAKKGGVILAAIFFI